MQKKRDFQSDLQAQIKGLKSELDEQQQKLLLQQEDSTKKERAQASELSVTTRELTCCMVELTSLREQLCAKILQYQYTIKSFQKNICELTQALQRANAQEQYSREIVAHHRTLCKQVVADAKKGEEQTRSLLVELQNKSNLKEEETHTE